MTRKVLTMLSQIIGVSSYNSCLMAAKMFKLMKDAPHLESLKNASKKLSTLGMNQ